MLRALRGLGPLGRGQAARHRATHKSRAGRQMAPTMPRSLLLGAAALLAAPAAALDNGLGRLPP